MQRDFNLDFRGLIFDEYGTFLCHPAKAHTRIQACPIPKPHCNKVKQRYEVYNASHGLHILKPDASKHAHEKRFYGDCNGRHGFPILKSYKTTTSSHIPDDHEDCLQHSQAEIILEESRKLRDSADRLLKANGDEVEISEIYLHAGLKLLKGAYLLECCSVPRPRDATNAIHSYVDAAKLFNYYAQTNEKNGKFLVATLAYKCVEVAYMRVGFSLQNACTSSKSMLYEANISTLLNLKPKSHDASHLIQLLKIAKHVNDAMDASMKYSRSLELAIRHHSFSKGHEVKGLSSVKKALDFGFYSVEDFIHLVTSSLKDIEM